MFWYAVHAFLTVKLHILYIISFCASQRPLNKDKALCLEDKLHL